VGLTPSAEEAPRAPAVAAPPRPEARRARRRTRAHALHVVAAAGPRPLPPRSHRPPGPAPPVRGGRAALAEPVLRRGQGTAVPRRPSAGGGEDAGRLPRREQGDR